MPNEIKIIRFDDETLSAIKLLANELRQFRYKIEPVCEMLSSIPSFSFADLEGEIEAVVDGETYVHEAISSNIKAALNGE